MTILRTGSVISERIVFGIVLGVLLVVHLTSIWKQDFGDSRKERSMASHESSPFAQSLSVESALFSESGIRQTGRAKSFMSSLLSGEKVSGNHHRKQNVATVLNVSTRYSRTQGGRFALAYKSTGGNEGWGSIISESGTERHLRNVSQEIIPSVASSSATYTQEGSQQKSLLGNILAPNRPKKQTSICIPLKWANDQKNTSLRRHLPPLDFIHIAKNGGIAIESAGLSAGIRWGSYRKKARIDMAHVKGFNASCRVPWWHLPVGLFDSEEEYCSRYGLQCRSAKFCVVRDPRTRIFSQLEGMMYQRLLHQKLTFHKRDVVESVWNPQTAGAHVRAFRVFRRKLEQDSCYGRGRFFGQYDMVFDRAGKRICDHVLRFEDLRNGAFEQLMQEHGMCDVKLADTQLDEEQELTLKWNTFPQDLRRWVVRFYRKDFEAFYPEVLRNQMIEVRGLGPAVRIRRIKDLAPAFISYRTNKVAIGGSAGHRSSQNALLAMGQLRNQTTVCASWRSAPGQRYTSFRRRLPPLDFIHIAKNCGTSIERAGLSAGIKWGSERKKAIFDMAHVKGFNASCRVPWWHLPVGLFDSEEEYCRRYGPQCRSAKFCVVRDPRTRIFSQFGALRYHAREFLREAPDVVEWVLKPGSRQAYVRSFRAYIRRIKRNPCFGYGMHFGQYDMVFDKSGKRLCDHVLRFEDLGKGAFEELMQEHGMCDVRLGERKVNQHVGFAFRWNAVSEKVRQWVLKFYHKDFEAFYPEVLENPMVPLT